MKKFLLVILILAIFLPSYSDTRTKTNPYSNMPTARIEPDVSYVPNTLEELENSSPYIVKAILLDDSKQRLRKLSFGGKSYTTFGITVSSLVITGVYKGDLHFGEVIKLGEYYYSAENGGKNTLFYFENYIPSTVGKEYLFFLAAAKNNDAFWSGIYSPVFFERGRYPIMRKWFFQEKKSIDSMTNEELNLGKGDPSEYKAFYKLVSEKYMK
jgi:hypothetical protein